MFQISWKIKSFLFKVLSTLKLYKMLFFIQKRITKRSKLNYKKIVFYWDYHYKYLRENNSKTVLEFGAGKSLAQNIFLSYKFNQNLEQTLIDISKMLDLDLFNKANDQISKLLEVKKLPSAQSISDLKENYNINYMAPKNLKQIADDNVTFDACISSTTLEHLPTDDLKENFDILKNIVKKTGIISVLIDYSDHYSHTDKNIGNLNFLKFSESEWEKFNTPMLFQNRLRHQDYRNFFKSYGYKLIEIKGNYGEYPEKVYKKFNIANKETSMLWGHFLMKSY